MDDGEMLTRYLAAHRVHLHALASRILSSTEAADEALQETLRRLADDEDAVADNVRAWLTSEVVIACLRVLHSRGGDVLAALEASLDPAFAAAWDETMDLADSPGFDPPPAGHRDWTPDRARDPAAQPLDTTPEMSSVHDPFAGGAVTTTAIAESAVMALLVALDNLGPAARLAYVLHHLLGAPYDEIAPAIGRSPQETRQLADRARQRILHGTGRTPAGSGRSRAIEALLAAARSAATTANAAPPDEADAPAGAEHPEGWQPPQRPQKQVYQESSETPEDPTVAVVGPAMAERVRESRPMLIDGALGAVWPADGRPRLAFLFAVEGARICGIEMVADPARLAGMRFEPVDEPTA